jgi:hypothetical protein
MHAIKQWWESPCCDRTAELDEDRNGDGPPVLRFQPSSLILRKAPDNEGWGLHFCSVSVDKRPRRAADISRLVDVLLSFFGEVSDPRQPEGFALQGLYQQHQPENHPAQ